MKKFVSTMVAGFLGAALLLGVGYATGVVGGTTVQQTTVKGEPASFTTSGLTPQQVYEQNVGSVVEIQSTFSGGYDMWGQPTGDQQGIGTGFVVSESGDILTNAHVVSESGVTASSVTVVFKDGSDQGTQIPATIVGTAAIATQALILRMSSFWRTVICVRLAVSAASSSPRKVSPAVVSGTRLASG